MKLTVQRKLDEDGCSGYPYDEFEGFTKLAEIEWSHESWAFDLTGVWVKDSDGTLWFAHDSGCSCPSPWDRVCELERLYNLEPLEERRLDSGPRTDEWETFKGVVEQAFAELAKR